MTVRAGRLCFGDELPGCQSEKLSEERARELKAGVRELVRQRRLARSRTHQLAHRLSEAVHGEREHRE